MTSGCTAIDIARRPASHRELTAEHDGRIVADILAEWSRRHGQPYTLTLTGSGRR